MFSACKWRNQNMLRIRMNKWNTEKTQKMQKTLSVISNISFAAGSAVSLYVLVTTFLLYRNLPAGVCPIDVNRPWMYTAVALLLLSALLSFFEPKKKSNKKEDVS